MSLLPRGYLETTVAIESARVDGEAIRYRTIGTGFFIGLDYGDRSTSSAESYRLFLVTNRHVLADRDDLLIRVNTREGAARRVRLPLAGGESRGWAVHPDERVDVAVVLINARVLLEAGIELGYFRPTDMAFVSTMEELDIGPGEALFVLGFPMGVSAVGRLVWCPRGGWSRERRAGSRGGRPQRRPTRRSQSYAAGGRSEHARRRPGSTLAVKPPRGHHTSERTSPRRRGDARPRSRSLRPR